MSSIRLIYSSGHEMAAPKYEIPAPIKLFTMMAFPLRVRCLAFHLSRVAFILLILGSQLKAEVSPFPK